MQTYSEFRPTGHDSHINFDDDRESWFVVPVGRNRDSEVLPRANFQAALDMLGGESEQVEIHRFGHWGNGWFELLLIHPSLEEKGDEIEAALANYPVLNSSLYSEMEEEERQQDWKNWAGRNFVRELKKVFDLQDSTEEFLENHEEELYSFHMEHSPYCNLSFNYLNGNTPTRGDIATLIRNLRTTNAE